MSVLITPAPAPAEAAKVIHLQVLTNSRMASKKRCARENFYRYELQLRPAAKKAYLRFGSAFHKGRELIRKGVPVETAIQEATGDYAGATGEDSYDKWTITALLTGWAWHWQEPVPNQAICTERAWEMPLINPESGMASRTWKLAGKIDGVDRLSDGRIAVCECKTAGEDIGEGSNYRLRLRADQQIGMYVMAARRDVDKDVAAVSYDVIRKPTIRPSQVPTLDENGEKIVKIDATGERAVNKNGKFRQTGGEGMTLLSRIETPEEFATRLLEDITQRPEFYYQRWEIPVIQDELDELRWEMWQQAADLRAAQLNNRWFKNVGRNCDHCDYAQICLQHQVVDPANPPSGFEIVTDVNPELAE
jgi:hypothetical protein